MTETDWLACEEPQWLLEALLHPGPGNRRLGGHSAGLSDRKLRLIACAFHSASGCLFLIRDLFGDENGPPPSREAMDHLLVCNSDYNRTEVAAAKAAILRDIIGNPFRPVQIETHCSHCQSVRCSHETGHCRCAECGGAEWTNLEDWLRWNGGTVPKLAQVIYTERRFADLPILADALEEAGCDDADILAHCRGPGPHVCGCWAVDLLLEKE